MTCLHHPETPAALVRECGTALCSECAARLTFAAVGAGRPFGWRALRFWSALGTSDSAWGRNVALVLLIWMTPLFLLVLKMWVAMLIGVPALVVTALRRVVVLLRLRTSRLPQPA